MKIRPVFLMHEEGLPEDELSAVLKGISLVLNFAKVSEKIKIENLRVWRQPNWATGAILSAWNSVDWYLGQAKIASEREGQIHGGFLLNLLCQEPWQKTRPHYDIVVLHRDIYSHDCNFAIGLAIQGVATVISTYRFRKLDPRTKYECIVTETMHEVGHVFGLIPDDRAEKVEESLGRHCTNTCIMRQGLLVPQDWVKITQDRFAGHNFCKICLRDLRKWFLL
jgi:predicted Zn-dependent protease